MNIFLEIGKFPQMRDLSSAFPEEFPSNLCSFLKTTIQKTLGWHQSCPLMQRPARTKENESLITRILKKWSLISNFSESPRIVLNSFGALVRLKEGDPMSQHASLSIINGLHALIIRQCAGLHPSYLPLSTQRFTNSQRMQKNVPKTPSRIFSVAILAGCF